MDKLGYKFKKIELLKNALTHRSANKPNNERLEFLGDSILNFVIAEAIYKRYPTFCEGELSRMRAFLVKGETLASIAFEINLGNFIILGQGELKSGGFRRESILADAIEAIIAAIYLDTGLEDSKKVILKLYESRLQGDNLEQGLKDPKTQLQEKLQANKIHRPEYILQQVEGLGHEQTFHITCKIKELNLTSTATGSTRRKAEQRAAKKLLKTVNELLK